MIKKKALFTTMLLLLGLVLGFGYAQATSIPILNAGFEDPGLKDGKYSSAGAPDWAIYCENPGTYYAGVWNPTKYDYYDGAPEGRNVGYIDIGSEAGVVGFEQTLQATLTQNMTYLLEVKVGNTLWNGYSNYKGFPGYRIELLAGNNLLAFDQNGQIPADGQFMTSQVSYTALANDPLGQDLVIRLLNLNEGPGQEVDFDKVSLSATPIATPEPATMLLLGMGLIGLAGFGRKRFKNK